MQWHPQVLASLHEFGRQRSHPVLLRPSCQQVLASASGIRCTITESVQVSLWHRKVDEFIACIGRSLLHQAEWLLLHCCCRAMKIVALREC
eukprot:5083476-Amphidinium_carterae.1